MAKPRNIAVRGPNWLGDHVMAQGFYRRLAAVFPEARRTLIVPEFLEGLPHHGLFHEVRGISLAERKRVDSLWSFSRWISEKRFDHAYILPATLRAALPFFLARVPERTGFSGALSKPFLTASVPWPGVKAGRHKSELYASLLGPSEPELTPVAVLSREKLIVLAPGASIELREWPYYEEFGKKLRQNHPDYRVVIVGTSSEQRVTALADRLNASGVVSLIGQTTLVELIQLCRKARLVVANDSGVAHVAATLANAPTIVLFGPGDPRYVTPAGEQVHVVRNARLDCSPCESSHCRAPHGYQACLKTLSVEEVLSTVENVLGNVIPA